MGNLFSKGGPLPPRTGLPQRTAMRRKARIRNKGDLIRHRLAPVPPSPKGKAFGLSPGSWFRIRDFICSGDIFSIRPSDICPPKSRASLTIIYLPIVSIYNILLTPSIGRIRGGCGMLYGGSGGEAAGRIFRAIVRRGRGSVSCPRRLYGGEEPT